MAALSFIRFFDISLQLIHNLRNFEHIKVNKEGNATFSLEMELKNSSSNVYLLKVRGMSWGVAAQSSPSSVLQKRIHLLGSS